MSVGRLAAPFLVVVLVLPLVVAAAPGPMRFGGVLRVNGAFVAAGTPLEVGVAGVPDLVRIAAGEDGAFDALVPADDPSTPAREGARAGEPLEVRALGGRAPAPVAFESGGERGGVELALSLPDLVVVSLRAEPRSVREGENVTVTGSVANYGRIPATRVQILATEGASTLAGQFLGDIEPNATLGFGFSVGTLGMSDARSWRVQAVSGNGDASPSTDVGIVGVVVEGDAPPLVRDLRRAPVAPAAGETVILALDAEDPDGIRDVTFHWRVGEAENQTLALTAPFQAVIGAFAAGETVRYWAVVTDAGPLSRATTTPAQVFEVRGEPSDATPAPREETPGHATPSPAAPRETPWPGVAAVAATLALAYFRRRT